MHSHFSGLAVTVAHVAPRLCLPSTNVIPSNPSSPGRWEYLLVAIREHSDDKSSAEQWSSDPDGSDLADGYQPTNQLKLQFNATAKLTKLPMTNTISKVQ